MSTVTSTIASRRFYQRVIPLFVIAFFTGLLIIQYFVAYQPLKDTVDEMNRWGNIISAFAMLMATIYLIYFNGAALSRGIRKGSFNAAFPGAAFLVVYLVLVVIALSDPNLTRGTLFTLVNTPINTALYTAIYFSGELMATWMALVRLGPIRNLEGSVLFAGFFLYSLTQLNFLFAVYPQVVDLQNWFLNVEQAAVMRSVVGAAGVGSLILALRALVGKEPGLVEMEVT